jgi:LuxR family maltose regulon positive regulatory protein
MVVTAAAGSGKSTLAAQWAAADSRSSATLRLAAYMDEAAMLASGLIDVLEALGPAAPETRSAITGSEPGFSAMLLPGLTRLASTRTASYLLVIDDVHLLRSIAARQVLAAVCAGVPDGSTVALLTRHQTPDWLARTRVEGRLAELTSVDLAFDAQEGASLLKGLGLDLDAAQVEDIVAHTEGWAVGMYLTALALPHPSATLPPSDMGLARGSNQFIADYLSTEVLATLDEDRRDFLTRSSILEELNGPLCDAVLERSDSAAVLADLHRRLQLVTAVDGDGHHFRCHHLLAEALTADLLTQAPGEIPALHGRAAQWYEAHGDRDTAIRHAIASGDIDRVSELIWPEVVRCVGSGRIDRLHSWLAGLTDRQIAGDAWLSLAAAWAALQRGDGASMGRWALIAEGHAGRDRRADGTTDGYVASLAVLGAVVGSGGLQHARELSERGLEGLAPDDGFRAAAAFIRGVVLTLQRDIGEALASLEEADQLARSLDVPIIEADAKSWLGMLAISAGDRERGIHLITAATDVIRRNHLDRLASAAHCLTAQALVLAMRGDKAAALTGLATARRLSGLVEEIAPWFAVTGRLVQARTAILLGDGATARLLISEAKRHMTPDLQASSASDSLTDAEEALGLLSIDGIATRPLTTAEMRILQFLPSHLTLPQIGEHLFLSQSTVKTHALSIYRKFDVASRGEAVDRARALGLVEGPLGD